MMWPFKSKRSPEKITRSALISALPDAEFISCLDRVYTLPTNEEVFSVLGVDKSVYQPEINDCNAFAYRAKGKASGNNWPFAVVIVPGHVLCGWLNDRREWVWMEPQTRKLIEFTYSKIIAILI